MHSTMMPRRCIISCLSLFVITTATLLFCCCCCHGLAPDVVSVMTRRRAIFSACSSASVAASTTWHAFLVSAAADTTTTDEQQVEYKYEDRNRAKQKSLIREDYWYMSGKTPPRKLETPLGASFDDPKYNTWGACETNEITGNSCTYVSLKQKIPAYSKYAFNIKLGAQEYAELGKELRKDPQPWDKPKVLELLNDLPSGVPCPTEDALLKAILLATALLTSPNYSGPPKELLVARFYVNEANFALQEIRASLQNKDILRARAAWEFGKDSWNSYFTVVNRPIVPKVGDQFELIS